MKMGVYGLLQKDLKILFVLFMARIRDLVSKQTCMMCFSYVIEYITSSKKKNV